jgi:hypothetical protein
MRLIPHKGVRLRPCQGPDAVQLVSHSASTRQNFHRVIDASSDCQHCARRRSNSCPRSDGRARKQSCCSSARGACTPWQRPIADHLAGCDTRARPADATSRGAATDGSPSICHLRANAKRSFPQIRQGKPTSRDVVRSRDSSLDCRPPRKPVSLRCASHHDRRATCPGSRARMQRAGRS